MRFIGKWLIWIGGCALLYVDLRPLVEEYLAAQARGEGLGPYTLEEWLLRFARPIFVMGVICAAALPDLDKRKARKKAAPTIAPAPAPPTAPPPATGETPPPPADSTPPAAL